MTETGAIRLDPPPFRDDAALSAVWDALPEARIAGGAVRDSLAGRPVSDIDLATPRTPRDVTEALTKAGLRVVPTGLAHGTVTAVSGGRGFEITTLRRDIETDGRHAIVAFTADWRQDASRRDFTINAMSMTRDGTVFDYFGGIADLAAGRVRFAGDPATRIREDYLRVLRFFRFYGRYASQPPDTDTAAALTAGIPGLAHLSVERVWSELRLILGADDPTPAITLMDKLGIWQAVLPEASASTPLSLMPADPVLRLAAMLRMRLEKVNPSDPGLTNTVMAGKDLSQTVMAGENPPQAVMAGEGLSQAIMAGEGPPSTPASAPPREEGSVGRTPSTAVTERTTANPAIARLAHAAEALALRLKLSNDDRDRLIRLFTTPSPRPEDDDATLRRLLADHAPADVIGQVWLDNGPAELRHRLAAIPRPVFPLEGRDVVALGIQPGPRVGALLRDLRQWWLDGGCVADAPACRVELARRACKDG